jgi:site-specific recombinase XerD
MNKLTTTHNQTSLAVSVSVEELQEAFADFLRLDVAQGDASPETVRTYTGQVVAFLDWCQAEGIHPAVVTEEDVKLYRAALISEGYARATIANKLTIVRRFYAMAQTRAYRADNPAKGVRAPRDRTDRAERVKWLPLQAIRDLLEAPDPTTAKGLRDRAILAMMAIHGLRVIEVARLQIEDLDPEARERGTLTVMGKGDKVRSVLLVEQSAAALEEWLAIRPQVAAENEGAFFVSLQRNGGRGTALSRYGIRKMVDSYLQGLGLKRAGISCHALRHSFATLSRAAGARLDALARALGHASVTTTQVYADIVDAAAENPARFLTGALAAAGE